MPRLTAGARVPDAHHWRGIGCRLVMVLATAVRAMLAGARSHAVMAERAADARRGCAPG